MNESVEVGGGNGITEYDSLVFVTDKIRAFSLKNGNILTIELKSVDQPSIIKSWYDISDPIEVGILAFVEHGNMRKAKCWLRKAKVIKVVEDPNRVVVQVMFDETSSSLGDLVNVPKLKRDLLRPPPDVVQVSISGETYRAIRDRAGNDFNDWIERTLKDCVGGQK